MVVLIITSVALVSLLASILVQPSKGDQERESAGVPDGLHRELADIKAELSALRRSMSVDDPDPPGS